MRNDYYIQIIGLLKELQTAFPKYNLGKHLSTALDGNGDVWECLIKNYYISYINIKQK